MIFHMNVIYTKKNSLVLKSWEGNGKFKRYLFKAYSLASKLDNLWNIYMAGLFGVKNRHKEKFFVVRRKISKKIKK